jgi:hypothetical protein
MIRETELNLFVPSQELLVRLASEERPLGVRAGPPRIMSIRETYFDTADQTLRRRGMTCSLRQVSGDEPSVVVTVGEGPDSENITSRSRLTAEAIGAGVFETLLGDSEPATQVQKFVDPTQLRPQIALDIQRLGRVYRGGLFLKPVLLLFFDRITVQAGGSISIFHEISLRKRRDTGPLIRDLAKILRDQYHLFPDGLNRLLRAYRLLAVEQKSKDHGLSPYGLRLALAVLSKGNMGLVRKGQDLRIPTFGGSGEDAARALTADLMCTPDLPLKRLGTTEPREGRAVAELWTIPDSSLSMDSSAGSNSLRWYPWQKLLEDVGRADLRDPTLIASLLLLTRRKLLGQIPWFSEVNRAEPGLVGDSPGTQDTEAEEPRATEQELATADQLLPLLRTIENPQENTAARVAALSALSGDLSDLFLREMTQLKGRILSEEGGKALQASVQLVDLLSIRIRGVVDRLYRCLKEDLSAALAEVGIQLRSWNALSDQEKRNVLDQFMEDQFPGMKVAPEWGPSFVPEMPLSGCAVGLMARYPGVQGTRFFHMVLKKDQPSFIRVPGTLGILPLEEAIRGYFLGQIPEMAGAEIHMFRFTTGAATIRKTVPRPETVNGEESEGTIQAQGSAEAPTTQAKAASRELTETRQSVVVRVLIHQGMPESFQTQLLRALERQVNRPNPMIGWSDLYPVTGPLDLSGLDQFLGGEI